MEKTNYFELFGVPEPDTGAQAQESAEPAAQTGTEGAQEQEVADPVEAGTDGQAADGDTDAAGESVEETAGDGQADTDKTPQSAEERRANAAKRREREQREAEERGRRAAEEAAAKREKEIFGQMQLKDPYHDNRPVTNAQEFAEYQQALRADRIKKDLKEGNLTQEAIQAALMETPELKQIIAEANAAKQQANMSDFTARREMELAQIRKLNPNIKSLDDIIQMPTGPQFAALVRRGLTFEEAYKTANFDDLIAKGRAAGEQRARNAAMSQSHLQQTAMQGSGAKSVPPEVKRMYRVFNPEMSEEDIAKDYNKRRK